MIEDAFRQVLAGSNFQVINLKHTWFTVLAQNLDGHAALLIRVSLKAEQVVGDGRGFVVKTERNQDEDYVRISSSDIGLPPVFLKLVEHVLERTGRAPSYEASLVSLVNSVEEFRRFSMRRGGRLSEDEVRGLFAELVLLRRFIDAGADPGAVVTAWKGALARDGVGIHDFTFSDGRGIEVKSTHQPAQEIRVSSPVQLIPTDLILDLAVLPVEEVAIDSKDGHAFRAYVSDTAALMSAAGPVVEEKWQRALGGVGLDIRDEYYDQWRFVAGTWLRFSILAGFPSVATDDLPKGVVKVTYSLELQHLTQFARPFDELISLGVS